MDRRCCRLCLTYPSIAYSLLDDNFPEMLEALTSIKLSEEDTVSTISCMKCLLNMKLAFNIQQNFLQADEKLKELALLNNVEVKLEVLDQAHQENESEEIINLCCSNCVICGISMDDNLLGKHIQEHFSGEQTCEFCNISFNNIEEYKGHFTNQHKCENTKCQKCGLTFRYRSLYNVHMKLVHKGDKKVRDQGPYTCDICKKIFHFKKQFLSHSHQREKCPICSAEITKNNLKKHVMNHSSGPQICELCGAILKSIESLRGHLTYTHSRVIYKCDECGKVFKKRYPYLLHKKKHSGEKSHICETCGKAFLTLYYLNKHRKTTHLKLRPFICGYCNGSFSSKFALRTHIRLHTNETPYKCEICGEGFRQNVSLKAHKKSKHNVIEPKTCACPVCGKLFGSDQAIISHMRLH